MQAQGTLLRLPIESLASVVTKQDLHDALEQYVNGVTVPLGWIVNKTSPLWPGVLKFFDQHRLAQDVKSLRENKLKWKEFVPIKKDQRLKELLKSEEGFQRGLSELQALVDDSKEWAEGDASDAAELLAELDRTKLAVLRVKREMKRKVKTADDEAEMYDVQRKALNAALHSITSKDATASLYLKNPALAGLLDSVDAVEAEPRTGSQLLFLPLEPGPREFLDDALRPAANRPELLEKQLREVVPHMSPAAFLRMVIARNENHNDLINPYQHLEHAPPGLALPQFPLMMNSVNFVRELQKLLDSTYAPAAAAASHKRKEYHDGDDDFAGPGPSKRGGRARSSKRKTSASRRKTSKSRSRKNRHKRASSKRKSRM